MRLWKILTGLLINQLAHNVHAMDPTDTLMDGDSEQSSYLPNHNMDPAVIQGGGLGQIWRYSTPTPANGQQEQFYAKPLVYTPTTTGRQVVLSFSEQNKMYALDAVNGTLYASRDLSLEGETPFLVSDLGNCNDISGTIGITGTPVIDPRTDTVYFWAKSYNGAAMGYQNGAYRFHGIDAVTLKERPGFPVNIQGQPADNDVTRIFNGGSVLQRPSLNLVNGVIFAGFGGHCDQFNYTGWIVGMSTSGKFITAYATSGGPGAPPQDGTSTGGGGGCGVWMSGMPIVSDNSGRIFYVTGNGYKGPDNQQQPASGRVHLDTLSECIVNMNVDSKTGVLTQQDYFEPYTYLAMDQGDRDLGAGTVCLPDPTVFSGGGVARIAISCGKNGQCYVVNRDNLGGYKLGSGGGDAIIQTLTPPNGGSIFCNGGTYPLEGGYFYVTPVGAPTYVYSLGFSNNGLPVFTLVSQTAESSSGRVGVGPPTITTYKGQPGTGIMWVVDPDAGIRAYNAVPVNGNMTKIPLPASPAVSKYQRPAFGNGRYYLSTGNGQILAYGSPVALPLTCNSVDFGSVLIGSSKNLNVTCVAAIPIQAIVGLILGSGVFQATNASLPRGALPAGASFSFPVVFNLTSYKLANGSTSAPAVSPGVQATAINVLTTNGKTGFSSDVPVSLTGKVVSANPFVSISPLQVDFPGIVIGSAAAAAGSASTFIIGNIGLNNLTIAGYAWTTGDVGPDSGSTASYTNVTTTKDSNGNTVYVLDSNGYFTSGNLPAVGTIIAGGGSITVNALFNTTAIGDYFSSLRVYSNGGSAYTILTGAASTSPVALLQYSTREGGWITIPDCSVSSNGCVSIIDLGRSLGLTISNVTIRFTNNGGSALIITKSKPPEGTVLFANSPDTDLSEGLVVPPGNSSSATISFEPGSSVLNADDIVYSGTWTLNTNDLTFGTHTLNFTGTLASEKTGPMTADGRALYRFLGCYQDNANGVRLEAQKEFNNANNTNGLCQNQTYALGGVFAGTEYMQECWVGSVIPSASQLVTPSLCSYLCPGDSTQICGGNGGLISIFYDSSRYFPSNGTIIGASGKGPAIVQSVRGYNYSGCWTDGTGGRALSVSSTSSQTNTLESCAVFCSGYTIFGTEYGAECYCGNTLSSMSVIRPDSDCSTTCAGNPTEFCGAGNRLSLYTKNSTISATSSQLSTISASTTATNPVASASSVGAYSYAGCQSDSVDQRTLTALRTASGSMTLEQCAAFCSGYLYFGTEYSQECYCGNTVTAGSTAKTDGRCSMACAGNTAETCGGANGLSLFQLISFSNSSSSSSSTTSRAMQLPTTSTNAMTSTTSTGIPTGVGAYNYIECHSDNTTFRTLQGNYQGTSDMTIEKCAGFCNSFAFFGVEYGAECYCGNTLTFGSYAATDGRCNMKCAGNVGEICGGSNGLTLFGLMSSKASSTSPSSSSASSSMPLPVSPSTSSGFPTSSSSTSPSSPSTSSKLTMPLSSSTSASSTKSSGSTNPPNSATTSSSSTSSASTGPSTSILSSSSTSTSLSLATTSTLTSSITGVMATTVTTSQSTSSLSGTTFSTSLSSPSSATSGNPWAYVGCANDTTTARALSAASTANTKGMTIESCQGFCLSKNYPLAGLEYAAECYCGQSLGHNSTIGQIGCTMKCSGNASEICGGSSRLSIYNYTPYVTPSILPTIGMYTVQGCYTDSAASRSLSSYSFTSGTTMTEGLCVTTCQARGFSMAGVEYGQECYCGNTLRASSAVAPGGIADCQVMSCSGNNSEYCAAGNRLLVYSTGS